MVTAMRDQRDGRFETTHGVRALARAVESKRIDRRTRRQLARLQHAVTAEPIEAVRGHLTGRIVRKELLAQRIEAKLLAEGFDLTTAATGLGKFAVGVWNSWRRDVELLTLLESKADADPTPSLQDYLAARANGTPATPASAVAVETPTAPAGATAPAQRSEASE